MNSPTKLPAYAKILSLKDELRKARFELAMQLLSDSSKIAKLRRQIAREYTKIKLDLKNEGVVDGSK